MHFSLFTFPMDLIPLTFSFSYFMQKPFDSRFSSDPILGTQILFGCVMIVFFEKRYKVSWHSSSRKANFRYTNFWPASWSAASRLGHSKGHI